MFDLTLARLLLAPVGLLLALLVTHLADRRRRYRGGYWN